MKPKIIEINVGHSLLDTVTNNLIRVTRIVDTTGADKIASRLIEGEYEFQGEMLVEWIDEPIATDRSNTTYMVGRPNNTNYRYWLYRNMSMT